MRIRNTLAITAVIVSCVVTWGCARKLEPTSSAGSATPPSSDFELKVAILKNIPATSAIALKSERTIKKGEGGNFVYPSSFVVKKERDVLIADNNGHTIQQWLSTETKTTELIRDSLQFPSTIKETNGRIYVSDNDGIKIFKENGQYETLLRTYYALFNFVVAEDQSIYANPEFRSPKDSDPLIVKLNAKGERVSGFGRRLNNLKFNGLDDRALLVRSGQFLFAGFKHRPVIEVFDLSGEKLIREIAVTHPAFEALEKLSHDERFTNPSPRKTALPRFIAGISVAGDSLFVLLHLPHVEIVEFDFQGTERKRYRSLEVQSAIDYFGLEARKENGSNRFYVGVSGISETDEVPFLIQFSVDNN